MDPDQRAAFIRRSVRAVRARAHVISMKRLALRTADAFARSGGSEAELADLLVPDDLLAAARLSLRLANGRDASE